jgi:CBS domain containing-hemolysin-like protein
MTITPQNCFDMVQVYNMWRYGRTFQNHPNNYKLKLMSDYIYAIILLLLALGGLVVRKTYFYLPVRELKRRAENHDPAATQLYRAVAFGNSLRGLLWLFIGVTSAASLVLLARRLPIWASLLVVGPLLWVAFSMLPASRSTSLGTRLTMLVTPPIAWLLNYLHPSLSRATDLAKRRYVVPNHTKIYERDDLLELIDRQPDQPDNRMTEEELEIAKRALSFGDYQVSDVLVSRKQLKTILADDTIGPILIDELHKGGQDQLPVRESAKGAIVGTLSRGKLTLQSKGHIRDVMDSHVYYLHESDSLSEALHAFFVTNHPLFVVVNSFEEYVGIVTVAGIVRQLLGHLPGDDFDQYSNLEAVAARHPRVKKSRKPEQTPVETAAEVLE